MSYLLVYFLSFFKGPACIISSIESLFKRFLFWGARGGGGGGEWILEKFLGWDEIRRVYQKRMEGWVCGGYMNLILHC